MWSPLCIYVFPRDRWRMFSNIQNKHFQELKNAFRFNHFPFLSNSWCFEQNNHFLFLCDSWCSEQPCGPWHQRQASTKLLECFLAELLTSFCQMIMLGTMIYMIVMKMTISPHPHSPKPDNRLFPAVLQCLQCLQCKLHQATRFQVSQCQLRTNFSCDLYVHSLSPFLVILFVLPT